MKSSWQFICAVVIYGILKYSTDHVAISLSSLEVMLTNPSLPKIISRRSLLYQSLVSSSSFVLLLTQHPQPSRAIAPITSKEADTFAAKAMRGFVPRKPKEILRQKLNLDFSVILLRSSYAIVDDIDIIAMNQFQRDFFLIRAAEYEPYIKSFSPGYVKQGDVTDPTYFDFISFAQYSAINRILNDPATVFEEIQQIPEESNNNDKIAMLPTGTFNGDGDDGTASELREVSVVVRRTIPDDQLLPTYQRKLGAAILTYLEGTYKDTPIAITTNYENKSIQNQPPSVDAIEASLTQIVKLFLINGFAWDGRVEVIPSKTITNNPLDGVTIVLTLDAPASLWGNEQLHRQRSRLTNDYLLYVTREFLQARMGCNVMSSYVKFQGNSEVTYIQL